MPAVLYKVINSSVSICVWQITETEEFFFKFLQLSPDDEKYIKSFTLPKRRLEKLACRAALATLLQSNRIEVLYDQQGAPQIADNQVSFAHSPTHVAVAVAKNGKIGIDIEPIKNRILNLYPKFLSHTELLNVDVSQCTDLHFYWGAKEAMYKYCNGNCTDYQNGLQVVGNYKNTPRIEGHIQNHLLDIKVQLSYYLIDDQMIVLCNDFLND